MRKNFHREGKIQPTANVGTQVGTLRAALKTASKAILSLALVTSVASCTNEEVTNQATDAKLNLNVGMGHTESRAIIKGKYLASGEAIGVMLSGADSYSSFTNVKFTASGTGEAQTWTPASDVLLTSEKATVYAYYPYADNTDLSAISIDAAGQTDYLYATPVEGISETKATANLTMKHVLTNINLTFADGTYAGDGKVTSVTVAGDGITSTGTFDATTGTFTSRGAAAATTVTSDITLGGAVDIMVVALDETKPITITATIDGTEYTATTAEVKLEAGMSYNYTLTLSSTFMTMSKVIVVNEWDEGETEDEVDVTKK